MPHSNPLFQRNLPPIWGYGIAVLSVIAVLLVSHWPALNLESAPVSLFLCAVMLSAWFGGVGAGSFAVVLAATGFYYFFLTPLYSFGKKTGQLPRFASFVLSALFAGALTVAQRRLSQSLGRARDDLTETVHELKRTNEAWRD
jgi:K+-sensing histidine kinase KdpD